MRFTLRDLMWATVVIALLLAWWLERAKTTTALRERDDAVVLWHDASRKWVEATRIPRDKWGSIPPWGLGGAAATPAAMAVPAPDEAK